MTSDLVDAIGNDQKERQLFASRCDMAQELQAGRIGPVKIFEEDNGRFRRGKIGNESTDLGKERRRAAQEGSRPERRC